MRRALFLILIWLFIATSCQKRNDAIKLLDQACILMETNPDSALIYIDSIETPDILLPQNKYMEYAVAKTQADYINHIDISKDTLVFEAKRYYEKKKEASRQLALH
ncbi:MAG: hypothetical protein PHR20_00475 [Bacteroidales bacterium]|nr:hypothetical protein [Bacteroidales bacterium]